MVSCVAEFPAAKLTKYLECKHEEASLLARCVGVQDCAVTDLREILLPRKRVSVSEGAMACLSAATLATQIHPGSLPPPSLFVTVSRILPSQI